MANADRSGEDAILDRLYEILIEMREIRRLLEEHLPREDYHADT